jgi:hypothetical protein
MGVDVFNQADYIEVGMQIEGDAIVFGFSDSCELWRDLWYLRRVVSPNAWAWSPTVVYPLFF